MRTELPVLDYTAISAAADCGKLYEWLYEERLRPTARSVPMHAGVAMHAALDVLYKDWNLDAALEALRHAWGDGDSLTPRFCGCERRSSCKCYAYLKLGHLEIVLRNYFEDRTENPTAVEESQVAHELAEEALVWDWSDGNGRALTLGGKVDLPRIIAGKRVIVDHKCSTQWINSYWSLRYRLGYQFRLYIAALQELTGEPYEEAYVNAIYIGQQAADPPSAWKTRKSTPNRLFGPIHLPPAKVQEAWDWANAWSSTIDLWRSIGHFPMNEQACGRYGGCPFMELCGTSPGLARKAAASRGFERWEPTGRLASGADGSEGFSLEAES